ncbi:MAG: hypothetical protein ABI882_24040, partial [Acidobacteriota bacterium]
TSACWRRIREGGSEALDFYYVVVALVTLFSCGRLGAHSQYVVEYCVLTLVVLVRAWDGEWLTRARRAISVQLVVLLVYCPLFIFVEEGRFGMKSDTAAERIYPILRSVPGRVLAQQSSFSLFTNGEIPIQLFHFTALARAGLWDMKKLEGEIEARAFAWVVTEFPIESAELTADDLERFTPEVVAALRQNYSRVEAVAPYFIYRPSPR